MKRTFKYKATVSRKTSNNADNWLRLCSYLYNACLEQKIRAYKICNKNVSGFNQSRQLPEMKKECPEFKQVGSQVLQDVVERLDKVYQSFFRRIKSGQKAGFPRFKSRKRYDSFTLKQCGWKLNGKSLYIRNVGKFKLRLSRLILGNIKTVTIAKKHNGWFVCFSCDNVPKNKLNPTKKTVGIDIGLKSFAVDSKEKYTNCPKFFRKSEKVLRIIQRKFCRQKKGSNSRKKTKSLVSKIHDKISNQRKDFLYKLANFYIKNYDIIFVEKLNVKGMIKNKHLSKSIADAGWSMFVQFLIYKAEDAGREIVQINPYNTTQLCSQCGDKVEKDLSIRIHKCKCRFVADRDYNAALNIEKFGHELWMLNQAVA